jgi:phage host-nuclease inhibitor protein Gam
MSVCAIVRDLSDIERAVEALINQAVAEAVQEITDEYESKISDLEDEKSELRQAIRDLQTELDSIE